MKTGYIIENNFVFKIVTKDDGTVRKYQDEAFLTEVQKINVDDTVPDKPAAIAAKAAELKAGYEA